MLCELNKILKKLFRNILIICVYMIFLLYFGLLAESFEVYFIITAPNET